MMAMVEKFAELGLPIPWGEERLAMMAEVPQEEVTTEVDVSESAQRARRRPAGHTPLRSTPTRRSGSACPMRWPTSSATYDEYHLAHNLTGSQLPEDDLFAGISERDHQGAGL